MQNSEKMLKMIPERLDGGTIVLRIRLFLSGCSPHLDQLSLQPPDGGLLLLLNLGLQIRGQDSILGQTMYCKCDKVALFHEIKKKKTLFL